jgi:hypothetical protein
VLDIIGICFDDVLIEHHDFMMIPSQLIAHFIVWHNNQKNISLRSVSSYSLDETVEDEDPQIGAIEMQIIRH